MANTCTKATKGVGGTLSRRYADESITERFHVGLDTASTNLPAILNAARAANPTEFPLRGQSWPANPGYGLTADSFAFEMRSDLGKQWDIVVTYTPLQSDEPDTEGTNDNPLLWPVVRQLSWIEREEAITEARNVQAFTGAFTRPALQLGPVVNTAYEEFDEGLFRTVRRAVLNVTKNVATLDECLALEDAFADTCNDSTILGVGPRKLAYLATEVNGPQKANGITYYVRTAQIVKEKTTDRRVNNVGWHCFDNDDGVTKRRCKVKDIESGEFVDVSEPAFLTLAGKQSGSAVAIDWRYLTETSYSGLLS